MPSHSVPFSSQYTDLGHHEWRARGCGITALKMLIDFWHLQDGKNRTASVDELLKAGLAGGAYIEHVGWSHGGLVRVARQYGYDGFNADLAPKSKTPETKIGAWRMLLQELDNGPVLASVYSGLNPERGGGHIVVVTGFEDGLVALNDPEQMQEREGRRLISRDVFLKGFKQRYVVILPHREQAEGLQVQAPATPGR